MEPLVRSTVCTYNTFLRVWVCIDVGIHEIAPLKLHVKPPFGRCKPHALQKIMLKHAATHRFWGHHILLFSKIWFTTQFQCPFWWLFSKRQNEYRFTTYIQSGSRPQTVLFEAVPYFTYTETNEFIPFCCFARKYHRFSTLPDASRAVFFFICAKTPSFKHGV